MTDLEREARQIVCDSLNVDTLSVKDGFLIAAWTELPGFSADKLRQLIRERPNGKSVPYYDQAVRDLFQAPAADPAVPVLSPLRCKLDWPWEEWFADWVSFYGPQDRSQWEQLRCQWEFHQEVVLGREGPFRAVDPPVEEPDRAGEPLWGRSVERSKRSLLGPEDDFEPLGSHLQAVSGDPQPDEERCLTGTGS